MLAIIKRIARNSTVSDFQTLTQEFCLRCLSDLRTRPMSRKKGANGRFISDDQELIAEGNFFDTALRRIETRRVAAANEEQFHDVPETPLNRTEPGTERTNSSLNFTSRPQSNPPTTSRISVISRAWHETYEPHRSDTFRPQCKNSEFKVYNSPCVRIQICTSLQSLFETCC